MSELPVVPEEAIQVLRWRFGEEASNSSGIVSSRTSLRLVWGLVHSKKDSDVRDGLRMATTLSKCSSACDDNNKELAYMQSVAHLKLGVRGLQAFCRPQEEHRACCAEGLGLGPSQFHWSGCPSHFADFSQAEILTEFSL